MRNSVIGILPYYVFLFSLFLSGTSRFSEKLSSAGSGFIRVLNGMAAGLFSSLIIGLILKHFGSYANIQLLVQLGSVAQYMMGSAIDAGVAIALGAPLLIAVSALACGTIGAGTVSATSLLVNSQVL